jgi:hypothetical protein
MRPQFLSFLFFFFLLLYVSVALSERIVSPQVPDIQVISHNRNGFSFEITFAEPSFDSQFLNGENYAGISLSGCGFTSEVGKPELPVFSKLVRLPFQGGFSVQITPQDEVVYHNVKVAPVQELQRELDPLPPFKINQAIYQKDAVYPEKMVDKGEIAIWRDLRVAPVDVYPFQYNPAKQELKFYKRVAIEITYNKGGGNPKTHNRGFYSEAFAPLYRQFSIGPEGDDWDMPAQRGAYLVITPPGYATILQDYVDWKTREGYSTVLATTDQTGTNENLIKAYIINAYNTWAVPPEYVVLVGDEDSGMPTFYITGYLNPYNCTDHTYALIEGDDYFPELFVGRLSVDNTTQLQTVLNKLKNYEQIPYTASMAWYDRGVMICDYSGAESTRYTKEFCEDQMQYAGISDIDNCYYSWGPGSGSAITNAVNEGVLFVNYRGYGGSQYWTIGNSGNYYGTNVSALNNGYKMPVVTSMVCGGGNFAYSGDPCFGEAWLREGTPAIGKAGVSFCGPSELNTHTKWNNNLDIGLYWGIFRENIQYFGPALLYAKMELWLDYPHNRVGVGSPTNSVGFYFYVYNILGDPGLRMWTGEPQPITAVYNDTINLGMNQFGITVTNNTGAPIPNAYVCIWKGSEIYEGNLTSTNGAVTLPMNGYTTGTMKLTVTGANLSPLLANIIIQNSTITLGIDSLVILDNNTATTSGNGDGMLSPAETVELVVSVRNYGTSTTANNVIGTLTTTSPKVTILNGTGNFRNLAPNGVASDTLRVQLSSSLTIYDDLDLSLDLNCTQGNWDQVVWAPVSDAEFMPLEYTFNPVALEPGSQANLVITLENTGLCDATDVSANIVSLDPLVQVLTGACSFGNILSGANGSNSTQPFTLGAASSLFPGHLSHLRLNFSTAEGYTPFSDLMVTVGSISTTDPLGPDEYGYYCFSSGDIGYSKAPSYSWVELQGLGTQLSLPDYQDEQDCRTTVALPFQFRYYGIDYDTISVCSNGFIAMGYSDYVDFRNKVIPSAAGAPAMVSAFWDDLKMSNMGSNGKVYKYHDATNHRYIIEYHNVKNDYANANEHFEIILYDPAFWPTPTGDGEIVIQYADVNDVDTDDNYCSVGMTDLNHTTGLQYVFSNIYPPSSHTLVDYIALKFTTDPGQILGVNLNFSFVPVNPPITIPAVGGNFNFQATVSNIGTTTTTFDFWTEAVLPNGNTISPILLRSDLSLAPGAELTRLLSQFIPAAAPAGTYTFRGKIGDYSTATVIASYEFSFQKSAH